MTNLFDLSLGGGIFLIVCLIAALAFEFVNGFHDTANAVATVIYTNALTPTKAVVLSGICNFCGVFLGGLAVAIGIIKLLPVELLVAGGRGVGLAMVLALLLSAIVWNLGTWYFGLPASSSHTLIGAILGVGLANSMLPGHHFGDGVNWSKAREIAISLVASPVVGFVLAGGLLLLIRRYARDRRLLATPNATAPPPSGTRALLILTCSGVSIAHGSNDGQKGVGLIMLILMGLAPAGFAIDATADPARFERAASAAVALDAMIQQHADVSARSDANVARERLVNVRTALATYRRTADIPSDQRFALRQRILLADRAVDQLVKHGGLGLTTTESARITTLRAQMCALTDYAPSWVVIAIAIALGLGTMVGWKRIVTTVGERIGKTHLTYAQGAAAELVAMTTIGVSAWFGLPVSTTHVLSSGVAGTMVAQGSGVRRSTVRNIALAWVLTLPAAMALSGGAYLLLRLVLA